jgi:hypothetical protein
MTAPGTAMIYQHPTAADAAIAEALDRQIEAFGRTLPPTELISTFSL